MSVSILQVDDLSPPTARRIISNEMSKSIETCGIKTQHSWSTADAFEEPTTRFDAEPNPNCGDITLSLSNENVHVDEAVDTAVENADNLTQTMSESLFIEDFMCDSSIDNRNTAYSAPRTFTNETNVESGEIEEPVINTAGRENIDLVPFHFNQTLSLENQIKNIQVVVDIPDEENLKEQISPKENKDSGTEKSKHAKELENSKADKLVVKVDNQIPSTKQVVPKGKDILNQERRSEPPRAGADPDIMDFVRLEKERMRQLGITEKFKNGKREKKKKKNRRNNRSNSSEDGQDFDTLYRLPTEHLTRHRNSICGKDRGVRTVEEQLRLHEELNERRKMVEMEKEHNVVGAVGGYMEIEDSLVHETITCVEGGTVSPVSEHSRDSSPTNEDVNVQRRFER